MGERAIDLDQAQAHLAELVQKAAEGEDVILTQGGLPVAKIISISHARGRRTFGVAQGLIHLSEDFDAPLEDFREYT